MNGGMVVGVKPVGASSTHEKIPRSTLLHHPLQNDYLILSYIL